MKIIVMEKCCLKRTVNEIHIGQWNKLKMKEKMNLHVYYIHAVHKDLIVLVYKRVLSVQCAFINFYILHNLAFKTYHNVFQIIYYLWKFGF